MKKTVAALFFLTLSVMIGLCGCGKQDEGGSLIDAGGREYAVGVKIGNWESRGKLFFDGDGALHFLHEDPTSPLFSLEEIFKDGHILSDYHNVRYESQNRGYGTGLFWDVFHRILTQGPDKTAKTKEKITYEYGSGQDLSFSVETDRKSGEILEISGVGKDLTFQITFSRERIK